jgi:hypothetical protein
LQYQGKQENKTLSHSVVFKGLEQNYRTRFSKSTKKRV